MKRVFTRIAVERMMVDAPNVTIAWTDRYVDAGEDGHEEHGSVVLVDAKATAFCDDALAAALAAADVQVAAIQAALPSPEDLAAMITLANETERRLSEAQKGLDAIDAAAGGVVP